MSLQLSQCSKIWQNVLFIEGALFASKEKKSKGVAPFFSAGEE